MPNEPGQALDALPHGPEFRFVDRLVSLDPGREAVAVFRLDPATPFLAGHFPGNPMMPGVLLVEAIAQLGGVVAQSDPDHAALADLRLTGIRAAKILGAVAPGESLEIHAKIEARLGNLLQVDGSVRVRGETVATAKVALAGR